jgi:predicted nucleotidyltransferase
VASINLYIKVMRLTPDQINLIKSTAQSVLGGSARVILFGSRVDDAAKGGDVDLLIEVPQALDEPALVSARIATRVSRAMHGRRVDVVLKAPNLMEQPIHRIAAQQGVML